MRQLKLLPGNNLDEVESWLVITITTTGAGAVSCVAIHVMPMDACWCLLMGWPEKGTKLRWRASSQRYCTENLVEIIQQVLAIMLLKSCNICVKPETKAYLWFRAMATIAEPLQTTNNDDHGSNKGLAGCRLQGKDFKVKRHKHASDRIGQHRCFNATPVRQSLQSYTNDQEYLLRGLVRLTWQNSPLIFAESCVSETISGFDQGQIQLEPLSNVYVKHHSEQRIPYTQFM
jgi:hypothetical protein